MKVVFKRRAEVSQAVPGWRPSPLGPIRGDELVCRVLIVAQDLWPWSCWGVRIALFMLLLWLELPRVLGRCSGLFGENEYRGVL